MNEMRRHAWDVVTHGLRPVLRKHRFKRPGGGTRFRRDREPFRQIVDSMAAWSDASTLGRFELRASIRVAEHELWWLRSPTFHFDARGGDPRDTGVAIAHWLETELIPQLELERDPIAMAREYEASRSGDPERNGVAGLWVALGLNAEAERVVTTFRDEHVRLYGDLPF